MSYYNLIELAKTKQGLNADNQLAIKMGIERSYISNWKSGYSKPDGFNTLILAELANVSAGEALKLVKEKGNISMSLLLVTSAASALICFGFYIVKVCILC